MIAKLSGLLDSVSSDRLILDVGGVGYEVFASRRTLTQAGQAGDALSLLIDMHVREDFIHLFGFLEAGEQQWFRLLTGVQGVGPKAALSILTVCPADRLGFAIASGDANALRQADGVGPKLATRIVTELKDKAGKVDLAPTQSVAKTSGAAVGETPAGGVDQDAVSALVHLGYARVDAYAAVLHARQNNAAGTDLQATIRAALKELGKPAG